MYYIVHSYNNGRETKEVLLRKSQERETTFIVLHVFILEKDLPVSGPMQLRAVWGSRVNCVFTSTLDAS